MLKGLLVAALLAFSTPSFAQSDAERAAQEVNAAVIELAGQTAKYEALTNEAVALVDGVGDILDDAYGLSERKASQAEVDRWAAQWIPAVRRRLADIEARLQSLPPLDTSRFERLAGPTDRSALQLSRMAATIRPGTAQIIDAIEELFEVVARHAPAAAAGDEEALVRLGLTTLQASQTLMQVENLTIQRGLSAVGEEHPQYWLMKSNLSTNSAVIEIIEAGLEEATNPDFRPRSHAEKIAAHVKEARDSARQAPRRAQVMLQTSQRDPELRDTELGQKLAAMMETYSDSAKVEEQICDRIAQLQRSLERKGSVLPDIEQGMADLEPLLEQRLKHDAARRQVAGR